MASNKHTTQPIYKTWSFRPTKGPLCKLFIIFSAGFTDIATVLEEHNINGENQPYL